MSKVVFGVWDGKVIDNRSKRYFEIEDSKDFSAFDEFDPGNRIRAYLCSKGFFTFDREVSLIDAAHQYMEKTAKESCGKCTPCRVGSQIIKSKLELLMNGQGDSSTLDEIYTLLDQMKNTSLCGLGQTAPAPIKDIYRHFRDELEKEAASRKKIAKQTGKVYITAPCIEACPAKVQVPEYIDYIKEGRITHSVGVVLDKYPMAETCGRVCVRFCEFACRRTMVDEAVAIKILKRFVAEKQKYVTEKWFTEELIQDRKPVDLKVAVIGAGPAGINAAYHLALKGYPVDIYEAHTNPGGMAAVGIPQYRLPKDLLNKECSIVESLGAKIHYGKRLGTDFTISDLQKQGYKAIFLGIGAQEGKMIGVPGENRSMKGYKAGISFLLYINHYFINLGLKVDLGKKMVIVGGGNVAMDCARSALRMGVKEVHLIYRRTKDEMPADHEEIEASEKEGVIFHYLTHPTKLIVENNEVKGIELIKMKLGDADESGRRGVTPEAGSEYIMDCDFVVPAIGQKVDFSFIKPEDNVQMNKWGLLDVTKSNQSVSNKAVFAGGDCVSGPATLIEAMAHGLKSAKAIDEYLTKGRVLFDAEDKMSELIKAVRKLSKDEMKVPVKLAKRIVANELDPEVRKNLFDEVEKNVTDQEAYREAERCLRCYRISLAITER
jgi:formate dehydrogenase beta subunit